MILIPEIETVVILVPRTGSGSLRRAILATYPQAMQIYRHMEADGIPLGYDRWRRVGVLRHPVERLWSLFNFLKTFGGNHDPAFVAAQRACVDRPFPDWIVGNETVFTSPYDSAGRGRFWPGFTCRHPLPETRKSQFLYLRPDLGTEVWHYEDLDTLASTLGVTLSARHNATDGLKIPALNDAACDHVSRFMQWDLRASVTARIARRPLVMDT